MINGGLGRWKQIAGHFKPWLRGTIVHLKILPSNTVNFFFLDVEFFTCLIQSPADVDRNLFMGKQAMGACFKGSRFLPLGIKILDLGTCDPHGLVSDSGWGSHPVSPI